MTDDFEKPCHQELSGAEGPMARKLKEQADRIEKLEATLRNIKDLHDQPGPEDELVVMIRDDMTYFIVCKALEGKDD